MSKTNNKKSRFAEFSADERVKITLGAFIILLSLYLYLVFISNLFTWKIDQSFDFSKIFSGPETMVDNWGGKLGTYLSNQFMNRWFGIASFFLPFILVIAGARLLGIK